MLEKHHPKLKQLAIKGLKYCHSPLAGFITNITVLTFCTEILNYPAAISYIFALFSASTASFFVCRYFVFKQHIKENIFKQYWKFISSSMVFRVVEFALFWLFVDILGYYYLYVFLVVQSASAILKFFIYNFIFTNNNNKLT